MEAVTLTAINSPDFENLIARPTECPEQMDPLISATVECPENGTEPPTGSPSMPSSMVPPSSMESPSMESPAMVSPSMESPSMEPPSMESPLMESPSMVPPSMVTPSMESPTMPSSMVSPMESVCPEETGYPEVPEGPEQTEYPTSFVGDDNFCQPEEGPILSVSDEYRVPTDPTVSVSETKPEYMETSEAVESLDDLTEAPPQSGTLEWKRDSMADEESVDQSEDLTQQAAEGIETTESDILSMVECEETTEETSLGILESPESMEITWSEGMVPPETIMDGPVLATTEHQVYMECVRSATVESPAPTAATELDSITMKSIESKIIRDPNENPKDVEDRAKVQECTDWIEEKQESLGTSNFGVNRAGVNEAIADLKSKSEDIGRGGRGFREYLQSQDPRIAEIREAARAYETLDALLAKRSACLEVVSQISSLEEAVQNCNLAVRNNWRWIGQMLQCAQVHFNNAADFHQFFHDAQEAEYWMKNTLSTIHLTFDRSKLQGDMVDVQAIKDEMRNVLSAYIQWQGKVDSLFDRAKKIVPVSQRLKPIDDPRPVTALVDYRTKEIEFIEGESLSLLDNSDKTTWKVKNGRGQVSFVPAVLLVIPGPFPGAIDTAVKMRIQLLALWTASVKRLGYQLIAFMLLVIKDYSDDEVSDLEQMSRTQQGELLKLLKYIEDTLYEYWNGYKDFEELQERILRIRFILEEKGIVSSLHSSGQQSTVVIQVVALKDLLTRYKDFWAYWETYKVIVELLKQPKFILICDKWEQLRFVTTAHFVRFWDTNLDIDTVGQLDVIEQTVSNKTLALHETPREEMGTSDITVSTEMQETETEEVETSVEEEERTFYMKEVVDPRDNAILSFQHAVMLGILDQANSRYINPDTSESISISEAINEGRIRLEWTSRKKIREEKKSYGLITIKTTRETRPYHIIEVIDPETNRPISVTEAMDRGILDTHNSLYVIRGDDQIPISEAIEMEKVIVDYHADKESKPEVVTRTYAVSAVVDQRKKDKISFAEAINSGLLDKAHGCYVNNVTGERINISEAIMRGFIKARVVTDVSKLDINPENKIVVERIQNVREKLMRGIKTIHALKSQKK